MTKQDHGYQLKKTGFKLSQKVNADDLTIISGRVDGCKELLSLVETFLNWTRTMEAKPTKYKSLAMKMSDIIRTNGRISTPYTPYNPLKTGQYNDNWRNDMIFREIVHQLVPAIIKARRPAVGTSRVLLALHSEHIEAINTIK